MMFWAHHRASNASVMPFMSAIIAERFGAPERARLAAYVDGRLQLRRRRSSFVSNGDAPPIGTTMRRRKRSVPRFILMLSMAGRVKVAGSAFAASTFAAADLRRRDASAQPFAAEALGAGVSGAAGGIASPPEMGPMATVT